MIGSEGTLGVITQATIQLLPAAPRTRSLVIPFDDIRSAVGIVPRLSGRSIQPLAVEFIEREVIRITEDHLHLRWPAAAGRTCLLVILDASSDEEMDRLSQSVAEVCLEAGALDVFVADTPAKQNTVLEIRSKIYEAIKSRRSRSWTSPSPGRRYRGTSTGSGRLPPATRCGSRPSATPPTATFTPTS